MIDHDRLFKELLSTFLVEFIELFLPDMMAYLDPESITFLDKEVFTDVTAGEKYEADLIAQVQLRGEPSFFLIHIENQASAKANFGKRMFRYFARLYEKYDYPVYPIVVFSYEKPKVTAPSEFKVEFPDFSVLQFNYRVIQLNRLDWRDFLTQQNPVAAALMAKMQIASKDRPRVKAECLRLLVTLKLDPARMQLIAGFVDTYLRLTPTEESVFESTLAQVIPNARGKVVEIVTSWELRGIEKGIKQGREEVREEVRQGQIDVAIFLLKSRLGQIPSTVRYQVEGLALNEINQISKQAMTFSSIDELSEWLTAAETAEGFVGEKAAFLNQLRRKVGAIAPRQKQKLLNLSAEQWQVLSDQAFVDTAELDNWLVSATDGESDVP